MSLLKSAQARTIVDVALKKGRELNLKPLAISVLDAGGNLIAFLREDQVAIMRFEISSGKAYACLGMGLGGRDLLARAAQMPVAMTALQARAPKGFFPMRGGVLVRDAAGEVVGAVGVSGDTSENDEVCAIAGVEAAGLKADAGTA